MAKAKKVAKKKPTTKRTAKKPLKKAKTKVKAKASQKLPAKKTALKSKASKSTKKTIKTKKVAETKRKSLKPKLKKKKTTSKSMFKDLEKEHFLVFIERFVHLHKNNAMGLHSLAEVERILDKYNQHYKTATEKFDAIVDYGMKKNIIPTNVYIDVNGREKETTDLYKLLSQIGKGAIKFDEAKDRMIEVYEESPGADEHLLNIDFEYNKPKSKK